MKPKYFLVLLALFFSAKSGSLIAQNGGGDPDRFHLKPEGSELIIDPSSNSSTGEANHFKLVQRNDPTQDAYPMLRFDLAHFSGGTILGDGTLTLRLSGFDDGGGLLPHSGNNLQVKALPAPFNSGTTTYENYPGFVLTHARGDDFQWVRNDIDSFSLIGSSQSYDMGSGVEQNLQLTIPRATLQDWVDHPSENYGIILFRAPLDHEPFYPDMVSLFFSDLENQAPTLSFAAIPEPASCITAASALLIAILQKRRTKPSRRGQVT